MRAILNTEKKGSGISSYKTNVDGKPILLDLRFLGDGYYDSLWQQKMLQGKEYHNKIVPRLNDEDYFLASYTIANCKNQM